MMQIFNRTSETLNAPLQTYPLKKCHNTMFTDQNRWIKLKA